MIKQIGVSRVRKHIKTWSNAQLLLYIDALQRLKSSYDVYETVLWNDVSLLLEMALLECVERLRAFCCNE